MGALVGLSVSGVEPSKTSALVTSTALVIRTLEYTVQYMCLAQASNHGILAQMPAAAPAGSGFAPRLSAAMPPKGFRRKLKRCVSHVDKQVEVQMQKCIRGGKRRQWMVLETQIFLEKECVSIKSTQPWLHMLLAGTLHRSKFHNAIKNLANECHDAFLAAASSQASSRAAESSQASPAAASSQVSCGMGKVGRAKLIQRHDSDEENIVRRPRQKSSKNRDAKAWVTVTVRGMSIECYSGRGRQLLVPIAGESLDLIVQHLSTRAGEELNQRCAIASPDKTAFSAMLTHEDVGKIAWRPNLKASSRSLGFWQIIYRNMRGRERRGCSGLSVPSANLAGTPWSTQEQLDAASMVLKKARAQWNLSDCSTAERLPEEIDDTT